MTTLPAKPLILVVDDDPDNLALYKIRLEDAGYQIQTAESGEEAFQHIEKGHPDVILLDRTMPGMDGIEITQRLRSNEDTTRIPILMITGRTSNTEILEGFHAGVLDYVAKPIDWDILLARLNTHVRLSRIQYREKKAIQRLEKELSVARQLQRSQMPGKKALENINESYGVDIAYCWRPTRYLGGDFWDTMSLADGTLGILMTDFSGDGVSPSFHTIRTKTFLHARCMTLYSPSLTLTRLNSHLLEHLDDFEIAKGFYAIYNPDDRSLYYSAAGSPSPLIYSAKTRGVKALRKRGVPLGAFAESHWSESRIELEPGDIVMFYTDGILRIQDEQGKYISERQLGRFFLEANWTNVQELCDMLEDHLLPYWGESENPDDLTMVFMQVQ